MPDYPAKVNLFAHASRASLLAALLALSACSPHQIEIRACTIGPRLAFWIEDTDGWLLDTTPRPESVRVFEPWKNDGYRWETNAPTYVDDSQWRKFRPKRKFLAYGQTFPGWAVTTPAQRLIVGTNYRVDIWTDGGRGTIEFVAGARLLECRTLSD